MNQEIIVDVKCVEHVYPGGGRVDLCGIEFNVKKGQRVAVLGANGSGKSTLLRHILGILKPTQGEVRVFGKDPVSEYPLIRSKIGAVTQNVDEQLIGPTVFDDVAFSPLNFGFSQEETYERVESILKTIGIYHLRNRLPHYLSGGERKKVALAGALVFGPELLILDEPLEGVDYTSRQEISAFLKWLHKTSGMTIISTTHDMDLVADLADVGYVMGTHGKLELYGTISDLFFDHDLTRYNLASPAVVKLIKDLAAQGIDIEPTLDEEVFVSRLMEKMKVEPPPNRDNV